MSPVDSDRILCRLSCPYPMLINMLIKSNSKCWLLQPQTFFRSDHSSECFEVVTALRIAAGYRDLRTFCGRADVCVLDKLKAIKESNEDGVFLAKNKNQEGTEGAGLSACGQVLEYFQCKHPTSGEVHQEVDEINKFYRWVIHTGTPWAKELGCSQVMCTFVTDRAPRDYRCEDFGEQDLDGVKVTFRLFAKVENKAAEGKLQANALDSWLPAGVVCM